MDPETRRQLEAERLARVAARRHAQQQVTHAPAQSLALAAGDAAAHVPILPTQVLTDPTPTPAAVANVKKRPRSPSPLPETDDIFKSRSAPPPVKMARRDDHGRGSRARSGASQDRVVVVLSSDTDDGDGSDDDISIVEPKSAVAAPATASSDSASSRSAAAATTASTARQYKIPPAVPRSTAPPPSHGAQPKYLDGGFYMTAVGSSTTQHSTVRFSDLVDKSHITAAILSSYVWEEEWLLPHFPADTRFCFINNAKSPIQLPPSLASTSKLISPPLTAGGAFGCMHTKLCLLVYPTFIRFVLGSANLIAYDWTGMANVIYVHDFPRLTPQSPPNATDFYTKQLAPLLRDLGVPEGIHKIVGQCDSSGMGKHGRRLVRSRPGSYLPSDGYGLAGMVDAVKVMGLPQDKPMIMTCATSSVGSLDTEYLRTWGDGIMRGEFAPSASAAATTEVRIVYPTSDEVVRSVYGIEGGGSLWLRKEVWDKPEFPRHRFWTLDARCRGFLSHAKTIVLLPQDTASTRTDGKTPIGLYYAGSHNFTRAAWGSLTKRESKCRMSNYETGIVCPITSADQIGRSLPVAYGTGSRKYVLGKEPGKGGDMPWMQEVFQE
ncbi:tyrosyl-DNA phosphodiesterase-domain-containing protein [Catenaria anguillulae PL171]|uniref:Tyrosyl-DNA phosphodiesterase-domain-containing protein n=1 Tax=Catenaria anguillulae PL171 TaxID=765915 RepID=A0A1Y2HN10_9FUNG|nr:tyrosyl-DNA phosphodiesterase-domain-containing protein [Catenaria anguillulae PL171]